MPAGCPPRPNSPLISAVVPMLNEARNVAQLLDTLEQVLGPLGLPWELVAVDDGSSDGTGHTLVTELKRRPCLRGVVLCLSRNFGKEAALSAGLQAARGDVVVPLDADLQDPPALIAPMLEQWRQGFDVVYAVRVRRQGDSPLKRITAFAFYRVLGSLSDTSIPADTGDFRLMDRAVVDALCALPERSRFMKGLFAWVGFRQTAIPYERAARALGSSGWSYPRLWNLAVDGLTSFSRMPLQVISSLGMVVASLALLYGGWLAIRTLVFGVDLPGYASLITAILFLGGLQLISTGVLGEYIGRIFIEVKQRPLYLIRERIELGPTPEP